MSITSDSMITDSIISDSITIGDIQAAHKRLAGQIIQTPYLHSQTLSRIAGCELFLKFENLQFTASFKERGAGNKLAALSAEERQRGVITVSAGNHAQGVAYHASKIGIRAVIVMPLDTPYVKVENTRRLGAEVVQVGESFGEARTAMLALAEREQLVIVHPYDDPWVIAGQGTLGLEMMSQVPDVDCLVVPIGGGGLIAGIALAAQHCKPGLEIIGVQAAHFPAMHDLFYQSKAATLSAKTREAAAGKAAPVEATTSGLSSIAIVKPLAPTIAEGIAVDRPGSLTAPMVLQRVSRIDLVSEAQLEQAIIYLLEIEKTVVEGAGAAGLAAVLANPERFKGRRVGLVLCGGNIDSLTLSDIIQRSLVRSHRLARLSVSARDVPGSLARVATLVAEQGANIEEVTHQRAFADLPVRYARIELVVSTRGDAHLESVVKALAAAGFPATVRDS
jgi:threonine dehydratase